MVDEPIRGSIPDASFVALPGMERARALLRGLVPRPPLSRLTGYRLTQVGSGSATMTMPASPWLQHGGGLIDPRILVEEALAAAVLTGVPAGHEVRTMSLSLNHLRPCTVAAESFVARARTVNSGPTFTVAEVFVEDAQGRGVVHATGSFLIRAVESPATPTLPREPVEEPAYTTPDPYLRPPPREIFTLDIVEEMRAVEVLRAFIAEDHPLAPLDRLLGLRLVDVSEGLMSWVLTTSPWLCSRGPEVAAGVVAVLVIHGLAGCVATLTPTGHFVGVVDESIDFLVPVPADAGELVVRAKVVHEGELLVSTAEVVDAHGNRVAIGHEASVFVPKRRPPAAERDDQRVLATVLFTDIAASTEQAEQLGDARWCDLLDEHHALVRKQLGVFKGREVKTTGDGFLATFDSPGRAVQAARAIRDGVGRLGLKIRAGLHTGECEVTGADVAGIAVHIASRIQALAVPGEILVSGTVRDLVTGSGLRFTDRGRHPLKGIEGDWQVFTVDP